MSDTESESAQEYQIIEEGPASTVYKTRAPRHSGESSQWLVVKTATLSRKFSKEPHDIAKELRILKSIKHPNIITVLYENHSKEDVILEIWEPYVPFSLSPLLASPAFSPHLPHMAVSGVLSANEHITRFEWLTKSIFAQLLSAVSYLHHNKVAHRDIKPRNVLLNQEGRVQLIDFGIVYKEDETKADKRGDLWPEYADRMYFEVSTGPYRAPELLFGTRTYDAKALDLWSLGATFAEFFTPLKLSDKESDAFDFGFGRDEPLPPEEEDELGIPFITPKAPSLYSTRPIWDRKSLFDGTRGEIGLAWSIFKVRGTANDANWPGFKDLPGSSGISFIDSPTVKLVPLLPNLPPLPSTPSLHDEADRAPVHYPAERELATPLDMIARLLTYPPELRLKAEDALKHPWLTQGANVLLPTSLREEGVDELKNHPNIAYEVEGRTLADIFTTLTPYIS